jgi:hypothetical protein
LAIPIVSSYNKVIKLIDHIFLLPPNGSVEISNHQRLRFFSKQTWTIPVALLEILTRMASEFDSGFTFNDLQALLPLFSV